MIRLIRFIFIAVFLLSMVAIFAQPPFKPLKSKGEIPAIFVEPTYLHVSINRAQINQNTSRVNRKAAQNFHLYNNYHLDKLLRSGNILFGNELSNYVQRVGDYVLSKNPDYKDRKIQFYVVKAADANAFANFNGVIFVNIGLLARLDNEAELAYVLSHELVHYANKDGLTRYAEVFKLEREINSAYDLDYNQKKDFYINYSQDQELTADKEGFLNFYSKTDYDLNPVFTTFDMLQNAQNPFENKTFNIDFLTGTSIEIPKEFADYDTTYSSNSKNDDDDSEMLHPNIKKRVAALKEASKDIDFKGDKKFIVSEDDFYKIRKLARYELGNLYVSNGQYGQALYNSFLLEDSENHDEYLDGIKAYALYGIAKYKKYKALKTVFSRTKTVEGHSQKIYNFINHLSKQQLLKLAVRENYIYYQRYRNV